MEGCREYSGTHKHFGFRVEIKGRVTRKEQVTNYRQTREGAFAGLHLGLVPRAELGEAKVVTVHGPFLWFQTHDQCCQLQTGTCQGCLPSTSARIKSCAAAASDLQHLLKGVHVREQK